MGHTSRRASAQFSRRLDSRMGAGEPLDARLQSDFAPLSGGTLEAVRIHRDGEAGELAHSIAARAFTTGRDIYFAPGEYRPDAPEGRRVVAHELAHVAQQSRGETNSAVQRLSPPRRVTRANVHPWRDQISGEDNEVETGGGTPIRAWVANSPWQAQYQYWCHGHTLGTIRAQCLRSIAGDSAAVLSPLSRGKKMAPAQFHIPMGKFVC